MDVSIIIVNWNTCGVLRDCLASIYAQTRNIEFEVIVIDNASTDGSAEMVKGNFAQVKLIENPANRGFAAANNQGIAIAKGRYVLLLNSDTIILNDAILKTVSYADDHLGAAVISCRVLNPDKTLQPTCFMFPSLLNWLLFTVYLYKLFPSNRFFGRERMTWWRRDTAMEVDVVTGCFMLVRQEAIKEVGIMDERFFMYAEEIDWCYRFHKAGWKNLFTPEAEIIHLGGASATRHGTNRPLMKDASTIKLMFKHWPRWKAHLGSILLVFFYLSRLTILLPLYVFNRKKEVLMRIRNHVTGLKGLMRCRQYLR